MMSMAVPGVIGAMIVTSRFGIVLLRATRRCAQTRRQRRERDRRKLRKLSWHRPPAAARAGSHFLFQ